MEISLSMELTTLHKTLMNSHNRKTFYCRDFIEGYCSLQFSRTRDLSYSNIPHEIARSQEKFPLKKKTTKNNLETLKTMLIPFQIQRRY